MTYIKWQDELESYLGAVSREEKQKVFAYFAEMYADKRDAGFSEEEIIEEFGAPYDAAKRILSENGECAPEKRGQQGGNKRETPPEAVQSNGQDGGQLQPRPADGYRPIEAHYGRGFGWQRDGKLQRLKTVVDFKTGR